MESSAAVAPIFAMESFTAYASLGQSHIIVDMRPRANESNGQPAAVDAGDDALEVSRSQRRREALDVLQLAHALVALPDAQLKAMPLTDDLREEIRNARGVKQQIAHKRQTQFLAKQMRRLDDGEIEAIRAALDRDRGVARRETAALHQLEAWRDRLIEEGDEALGELLTRFPDADRQQLRQLARQARTEREQNKPLHAYRELFRLLREIAGN
jgi:ribosome-associated protein